MIHPDNSRSRRLLVLIYSMANGRADVVLPWVEICAAADRLGLYEMSEEAFEVFWQTTIARVKATKAVRNN